MAAIDWETVVALAPGLSSVSKEAQDLILAEVNVALDIAFFNDGEDDPKLRLARVYRAAHFGELVATGGGGSGPVASRSQGDMSISYMASAAASSSEFGKTGYGQLYLSIIRGTAARGWLLL